MAKDYNVQIPNVLAQTTVVGRVVRDAVARFTPSGAKVANVTLAISRRYLKNDVWEETTSFIEFAVWGDAADRAANLKQGMIATAEFSLADLSARSYEKTGGETGVSLQVGRSQISRLAWDKSTSNGAPEAEVETPDLEGITF